MSYYMTLHPAPSAIRVESLLSQHSRLEMYRRSLEWQLGLIAEQLHEDDVLLVPCSVFPLLELRGSVDVNAHLEQIARILREAGYWKPAAHAQDDAHQDVYQLGKSAQKLFDDCAALDRRVRQLQAGSIS